MGTLDETLEAVIDGAVAAVEEAALTGVKAVVRGDRARPMPALPAIWIVPQLARQTRDQYDDETWELPLSVAGLVKGDDPAEAGRESQRLTAQARKAVLDARASMRAAGAAVTDVTSVSFDPAARSAERNRTLFWTEAVVMVSFTVDDGES